jgi:hypothetical protein
MATTLLTSTAAAQLLASKDYFARSTRVLEESDSSFRPHDAMMTVAQHVAHVARTLDWFIDGAASPDGFDLDFEKQANELAEVTSLTEARQTLDAAFARAVQFIGACSADDLARPLPPGPIMGGQPWSTSSGRWSSTPRTIAAPSPSTPVCSGRSRRCRTWTERLFRIDSHALST